MDKYERAHKKNIDPYGFVASSGNKPFPNKRTGRWKDQMQQKKDHHHPGPNCITAAKRRQQKS
ncbi:MAG: hypothetical protein K5739_11895 [Lachnospiraceae bacterium]|nr:hypothetical protein [Lachnospiraceae bacterium]